jgi:hypothetical protein
VALIDVPGMYEASRPIMHYIKHTIEMYAVVKKTVRFDRNQPHVLKYSADDTSKHTGVEVSSSVCNIMLCVYPFAKNAAVLNQIIYTASS